MANSQAAPETREVSWQVETEPGHSVEVSASYAVTDSNTDTLLMTGLGETNVDQIAEGLAERGISAAVCNLPYPDGVRDPEIVKRSIIDGTNTVIDDLNSQADRSEASKVIGVSYSKGASEQIITAYDDTSRWRELIVVAPMGVNTLALGKDFRKQRRELTDRMQEAGITDDASSDVDETRERRTLFRQLDAGVRLAAVEDGPRMVRYLHDRGLIRKMFVGEEDVVFPACELDAALSIDSFVQQIKKLGHITMETPDGITQMSRLIRARLSVMACNRIVAQAA